MAPVDSSPANNMGGFELICSLKSNDTIPVYKYRSTNTGLNVFIAEVEGPVVGGFFCLATEAHDDGGLPHTLEHVIFLGSERYPYKGVLDLMANRCLASGTNAHTDTDNTFYTMENVGSEGFLTLMPIYLEHILYPTLKDSAYVTEVHHITGEGEDAGVVYCEMQSVANEGETLAFFEMLKAIYPGKCGYKSNTGGELKDLREFTTNEKVRAYHKEFYRPENLNVIITGQVKHTDVFKALQPLEENIMSKGSRGPFTRPWQSPVPPFTENVDLTVEYPCNDEDNGLVYVGWRGPSAVNDRYGLIACSLLMKYLTDTSASPLQKNFVEIDDPFASNVAFSLIENSGSLLHLIFENVPKPKISSISIRLMETLQEVASSGIEMQRMNTVIHRHKLETISNLESKPHNAVAYMIIGDILFGNSNEDLKMRLNEIEMIEKLKLEPVSFWQEILKNYFIESPKAVIKGVPSIAKHEELTEKERKRIEDQRKMLGEEGLLKKVKELQEAVKNNETPIPDEILSSVPIPSTESIKFYDVKTYTTDSEQHPKFEVDRLPFYTYLNNVKTNFVYMLVTMDTSVISVGNRPYIQLLLETILESPIKRDGTLVPYEVAVAELEADTVATSTRIGYEACSRFSCGSYSSTAMFILQVEESKYKKGVQWIKEILYQTVFTSERLKIIASKMINDVAQMKRKGRKMTDDLMKSLIYNKESNYYNVSLLRQHQFLTKLIDRLNNDEQTIISEIEDIRKTLTTPENMTLYIAANIDKITQDVYQPWTTLFSDEQFTKAKKKKCNVTPDIKMMNPWNSISMKGCVTSLGCVESMYLIQCCPGISDYLSPDLAPLLVCLQYFTQLEGPMWRQIRGQGLSYHYNIYPKVNEGLLYLVLYQATNLVGAYKEAKNIVESHLAEEKWERLLFESAKSSLIFEIVQREKSVGAIVKETLLSYFKNVPLDYNRQMVNKISTVTIADISRVAPIYLKKLFDPDVCKTTIVCHPLKSLEIVSAFKGFNHELKLCNSLEETYLNSW